MSKIISFDLPVPMLDTENSRRGSSLRYRLKTLGKFIRPYRAGYLLTFVFSSISAVFAVYSPKVLQKVIDEVASGLFGFIAGTGGTIDFYHIRNLLSCLTALYFASTIFSYLQGRVLADITTKTTFELRKSVMQKINRLPVCFFEKNSQGDIMSRMTNDIDTMTYSMNAGLFNMVYSLPLIVGSAVMMVTISPITTVYLATVLPFTIIFTALISKKIKKQYGLQQQSLGKVNGKINELFGAHLTIKAFNCEKNEMAEFEVENGIHCTASGKAQFFSNIIQPLTNFLGNLGYVFVCVFGAFMIAAGKMTIGGIQAFIQYIRKINTPANQLTGAVVAFQRATASAKRVYDFLDEPDKEISWQTGKPDFKFEGKLEFKDVFFSYYRNNNYALKGLSFETMSHKMTALTGNTGAGKSTIAKLILGFYKCDRGEILLDDRNINDFTDDELLRGFSVVLQEPWFFCATVRENIRYGRLEASDDEVLRAAKAADADDFIKNLTNGYDTVINEDASNLSQGQQQLLAIARALLKDSKVFIFDEATSFLNTETEQKISRALRNSTRNKSLIIIAHKPTTIQGANAIIKIE